MSKTIQETVDQIRKSLREYIEATYHIGNPALIAQRRCLLESLAVIHQVPYLESTPRYQPGVRFSAIEGLSAGGLEVLSLLSSASSGLPKVLHDPAYTHQVEALQQGLVKKRNLVIMTGTGSGKTESFLLPILGKLADEAKSRPASFAAPAMRALLLYPMNALVNDQLGRLRAFFGDQRSVALFTRWAGRPARFARYTSRTPYAGVRSARKDPRKFKSFEDFYVDIERQCRDKSSEGHADALELLAQLRSRGKWPAKPDMAAWFGDKGSHWQDKGGKFLRAVVQPMDSELLTRHEVQVAPPDVLVTNYSMLEYMLMRPIERAIFDSTANWLKENPAEKFTVVLDEAHLYRGAAGAEVGLLLRRLRDRLGIDIGRFQVICATASFSNKAYAPSFGAQLSGADEQSFTAITGDLLLSQPAAVGSRADVSALCTVDVDRFYGEAAADRWGAIESFLKYRAIPSEGDVEHALYRSLREFGPLGHLVNRTMQEATPLSELPAYVFPSSDEASASQALTALLALGSAARETVDGTGLLPCRVHNFFRGLSGLWVCMDPDCSALETEEHRTAICGRMYSQPRDRCNCGAQVLELFTCRSCGTAYGRAYTDNVESPNALWNDAGKQLRLNDGEVTALRPIDLLLEEPRRPELAERADYDLETGRLNSVTLGPRTRVLFIWRNRLAPAQGDDGEEDTRREARGQFVPCAMCGSTASSRSTVQDHQTKGDQPFQTLVAKQIQVQPPSVAPRSKFAPLRGRKVLVFSDSRQVAARLAPNLQMYSTRDALRPMLIWGYQKLQSVPAIRKRLGLDDAYLAVLLAANHLGVRLRPEVASGETLDALVQVERAISDDDALNDPVALLGLWTDMRQERPPVSLLDDIYKTIRDPHLGLEALALASLTEREDKTDLLKKLDAIPGVADRPEDKVALVRAWLRCWNDCGFWLGAMPNTWWMRPRKHGTSVRGQKSKFKAMERVLTDKGARRIFDTKWLPILTREFTSDPGEGVNRLEGKNLTLTLDGTWASCRTCKSTHRPVSTLPHCLDCGSSNVDCLEPASDEIFSARKGYYRRPVVEALSTPPIPPVALIAAEHTAQLNAPQAEEVFSKAEENELLFQDVDLRWGRGSSKTTAIDVLSSTTTMEVGIDIGALSGVALRNMPPGRANYQQRAGRAGRRGNAVATVVAFGSSDSHDEHYFSQPDAMIRGPVVDPRLTLDNAEIARRHLRAFLLQMYHQARIQTLDRSAPHDLFSVLGTVEGFRGNTAMLNREDFARWLDENGEQLRARVLTWLPTELGEAARTDLAATMVDDCLLEVDKAIEAGTETQVRVQSKAATDEDVADDSTETPPEEGDSSPNQLSRVDTLLDRLLYCGVLPRYAFPTDVATFAVFNTAKSTGFRHVMRYAPSQSLPVALSQYAPGKEVWIAGKCYMSAAIYSPLRSERYEAYKHRRIYQVNRPGF